MEPVSCKKQNSIKSIVLLFMGILMGILLFFMFRSAPTDTSAAPEEIDSAPLSSGKLLVQELTGLSGKLQAVKIKFDTFYRANDGHMKVCFYDGENLIKSWDCTLAEIANGEYRGFTLGKNLMLYPERIYKITIEESYKNWDQAVGVYLSEGGDSLFFDGETVQDRTLCTQLVTVDMKLQKALLVLEIVMLLFVVGINLLMIWKYGISWKVLILEFLACLLFSFAASYDLLPNMSKMMRLLTLLCFGVFAVYLTLLLLWKIRKKYRMESFFLMTAVPAALIVMLLFAPWNTPDARSHFLASYRFSNILMGKSGVEKEWLGRASDAAFFREYWVYEGDNPSAKNITAIIENIRIFDHDKELVSLSDGVEFMKYYSVLGYLPLVIGLVVGRIFSFGSVITIYLARLFLAAAYIAGMYHAIKRTPVGKAIFTMVALSPMGLMMCSAYSYDAMVFISTMNLIVSILCLYQNKDSIRNIVECMIWAFLVGGIKSGGYLLLVPVLFILFKPKEKGSIRIVLSILGCAVFSVVLFDCILPAGTEYFQLGTEVSRDMSTSFAFKHPIKYLQMLFKSYIELGNTFLMDTLGQNLGWLEATLPSMSIILPGALWSVYSIFEKDEVELDAKCKNIFRFTILFALVMVPTMLLSATPVGSSYITGIQGRYYIPFVPLAIMLLTKYRFRKVVAADRNLDDLQGKVSMLAGILMVLMLYYLIRMYLCR